MTKLAFIMAASHSGSTLLAMLLGSHPQATTIGDTAGTLYRKNPDYRCSCGNTSRACPFWLNIVDQMGRRYGSKLDVGDFGTRFEYPESRFIDHVLHAEYRGPVLEKIRDAILWLSPGWHQRFQAIAKQNVNLIETVTKATNSQILIDSSKLPRRLKFLLRIPELEVKVIHLVRDGRGVAHTYINDNCWSIEKSAYEWRRGIVAAEKLLSGLSKDIWRQLRYEDLCSNPRAELEKLCVFLNLDHFLVNLDFRSTNLHVFGNKMRFDVESRIVPDELWRSVLTKDELRVFDRVAGKINRRYGYA